jgi:hypothetical protein
MLAVPYSECDRHRLVAAATLQFLHTFFSGRRDRQQGIGRLRQPGIGQCVRFAVRRYTPPAQTAAVGMPVR